MNVRTLCLLLLTSGVPIVGAEDWSIRFLGRPTVRRILQKTEVYLGGDVEITAVVAVKDSNGRPVPNVAVGLAARAAREGVVGRLRAYGFTNQNGIAHPRAVFDLPVISLRTSLQACLLEPADECTPILELNLAKKTDLEVSIAGGETGMAGTQRYVQAGKSQEFLDVQDSYVLQVRPRFVYNPWEHLHGSRHYALTLYGEASWTANHLEAPLYGPNTTAYSVGRLNGGLSFEVASRLLGQASFGPALGGKPGQAAAGLTYVQPVGSRNRIFGGLSANQPLADSAPDAPHYGSSYGPKIGFTRQLKSGAERVTGWAQYQIAAENRFVDRTGAALVEPRQHVSSLGFDLDVHRGGPLYTSFGVSVGGIGTPVVYLGFTIELTIRNIMGWLP